MDDGWENTDEDEPPALVALNRELELSDDDTEYHGTWRAVPGIDETKLHVSSLGYVKTRITRNHWAQPTRGKTDTNGYPVVHVDRKAYRIHRLVCLAWHGTCPPGHSCDHINGRRSDNRATNLRWADVALQRANQVVRVRKQWTPDITQSDLAGELWKTVSPSMRLSNMGRVQFKKKHHFSWSPKRTPKPSGGMAYARIKNKAVHRLVYMAFVGDVPAGHTIDHVNQNKEDNRLANLRAVTPRDQNLNRTFRPIAERQSSLKKQVRVRRIDATGAWQIYDSLGSAIKAVAEQCGKPVNSGCASNVARGHQRHHRGYSFQYLH